MTQKKYLAIIPARKGSKGLPNKNILPFLGVPLFLNTCNILNSSKYEIDIYVSTDSSEIISICKNENINYIKRPDSISNDDATTEDVITHLLKNIDLTNYENIILAQCTSPLLTDIDNRLSNRIGCFNGLCVGLEISLRDDQSHKLFRQVDV